MNNSGKCQQMEPLVFCYLTISLPEKEKATYLLVCETHPGSAGDSSEEEPA